ncbi:HSP20 family protein [Pelagirhabdus alkalitolerans]|uniref:HSP20 family protein n=1 Tax=Pelagirhabdus alkalitolerans TaxID=1612202 RepID=A0A1G6KXC7_9BACI|nr:Hsp20/alpha crystallin family protein [Pelagirhabdus alkalitolerans]SDC35115.1 HSP20 family protein [Pelagirhabdus alkalitolerans]
MSNLFPRKRDVFDWLPSFFDREQSLFDFDAPKVDVKDKNDHYEIDAELPGFEKDDVVVEYKDQYLTIEGRREESVEKEDDDFVRRERSFGSFKRSFYVGDIDESDIKGSFKNGLLTLKVPKSNDRLDDSSAHRIKLD